MPDEDLPRYLSPQRFAEEVDMHRETVYEYLQDDRIPGARKVGWRWKIPRWALDEVGTPAHLATA
jgi:excisionase family DNA binding protein